MPRSSRYIRWFDEITLEDLPRVGGKNASIGEMVRALVPRGIRVPGGFAITSDGYRRFLGHARLEDPIREAMAGLDTKNQAALHQRASGVRQGILDASMPEDLVEEAVAAYRELGSSDVAVRSSATAEDLPQASFAGQLESFLNVRGETALIESCKRCFASLFTDRAISYRSDMGFDPLRVALSIGIQPMVRSDLAAAGVMFSIDTETGFRNAVLINASYGLGENVVQGAVNPDEYTVFKPTLLRGFRPILEKSVGSKEFKLIYDTSGTRMTRNVPVPLEERRRCALTDDEILTLARWAIEIEDYYSARRNRFTPMDMEWAKDGRTGELFIVQARPETVQARRNLQELETYSLQNRSPRLLQGKSVGSRIAAGPVRIIQSVSEVDQLRAGEILVADKTDPDWEPAMKRAAAIITNRGGRTCHAAIVSRELGVPAIVGTESATERLRTGELVTVCCAEGETGVVYEGRLSWDVERLSLAHLDRPRTRILVNIADPTEAFRVSFLPQEGVGLARIEFIIGNFIRAHPMALLHPERVSPEERRKILELTQGYERPAEYFIEKLAQGIGTIAAAFHPNEVIVRLSDFKTNEYAHLLGGGAFEPREENPMLGFRGASRYGHANYREGFALECSAIRRVRDGMGLTNVKIMVPFCRTVEEGKKVLAELAAHGLERDPRPGPARDKDSLEVYVMCEIPSNVVLARDFARIFDGFSIGSNDLTQLILGVDRDSEIVAGIFDERNPAVLAMLRTVIAQVKASGKKIGICGQAPSDYPEFARFLVDQGIDSISLNADALLKTTAVVLDQEHKNEQRARGADIGQASGA